MEDTLERPTQELAVCVLKCCFIFSIKSSHISPYTYTLLTYTKMLLLFLVTLVASEKMWFVRFNLDNFEIKMEIENSTKLLTMVGNDTSLELTLKDAYFRLTLWQSDNVNVYSLKKNESDVFVFERKIDCFLVNGQNFTKLYSEGKIGMLNFTYLAAYSTVLSFSNSQYDELIVTPAIATCKEFNLEYLYGLVAFPFILIVLSVYKRLKQKLDRDLNIVLDTLELEV